MKLQLSFSSVSVVVVLAFVLCGLPSEVSAISRFGPQYPVWSPKLPKWVGEAWDATLGLVPNELWRRYKRRNPEGARKVARATHEALSNPMNDFIGAGIITRASGVTSLRVMAPVDEVLDGAGGGAARSVFHDSFAPRGYYPESSTYARGMRSLADDLLANRITHEQAIWMYQDLRKSLDFRPAPRRRPYRDYSWQMAPDEAFKYNLSATGAARYESTLISTLMLPDAVRVAGTSAKYHITRTGRAIHVGNATTYGTSEAAGPAMRLFAHSARPAVFGANLSAVAKDGLQAFAHAKTPLDLARGAHAYSAIPYLRGSRGIQELFFVVEHYRMFGRVPVIDDAFNFVTIGSKTPGHLMDELPGLFGH